MALKGLSSAVSIWRVSRVRTVTSPRLLLRCILIFLFVCLFISLFCVCEKMHSAPLGIAGQGSFLTVSDRVQRP